jgi:xanthine/uracil/vitamin C permease (AzgA family)
MSGMQAALAIALLAVFLGGVMFGVVAVVSVASRREDRRRSLPDEAPDATSRGVRRLTGATARGVVFPPPSEGARR